MSTSKNQNAAERARLKAALAERPTKHSCYVCHDPILHGALFPVLVSQQGMRFYHRACAQQEKLT